MQAKTNKTISNLHPTSTPIFVTLDIRDDENESDVNTYTLHRNRNNEYRKINTTTTSLPTTRYSFHIVASYRYHWLILAVSLAVIDSTLQEF